MDPVNQPICARRLLVVCLFGAMLSGLTSAGVCAEPAPAGPASLATEPSGLEPLVSQSPGPAETTEATPGTPPVPSGEPETMAKVDLQGARDLFRLYGIDESHFRRLSDRSPWQETENELLMKVFYRLRQFRLMDIQRWSKGELEPLQLAQEPDRWRGEVFRISGRVSEVVERVPVPEVVERFEIDRYYHCKVQLGASGQTAVVFAQRVPKAWKLGEPIDEAVSAFGVFLKLADPDATQPTPVLATVRLAWHAPTTLGRLGMDMGLFDDIPPEPWSTGLSPAGRKRLKVNPRDLALGQRDRECFYQMLAAVGRAKPGELLAEAANELRAAGQQQSSVVPLFNDPAHQRAKLFLLSGWVRRAELVRVADEDIRSRFGIDHYYNLYMFTEDSLDNPLVLCVRELPKGMPLSEAPNYVEEIRAAAFFYKTWAYRSDLSIDPTAEGVPWQLAPLLIGREVTWLPRSKPASDPIATAVTTGLIVVGLLGIGALIWWFNRADRAVLERIRPKPDQVRLPEALEPEALGPEALGPAGPPDPTGAEPAQPPQRAQPPGSSEGPEPSQPFQPPGD